MDEIFSNICNYYVRGTRLIGLTAKSRPQRHQWNMIHGESPFHS
jgi:hypothetical protein